MSGAVRCNFFFGLMIVPAFSAAIEQDRVIIFFCSYDILKILCLAFTSSDGVDCRLTAKWPLIHFEGEMKWRESNIDFYVDERLSFVFILMCDVFFYFIRLYYNALTYLLQVLHIYTMTRTKSKPLSENAGTFSNPSDMVLDA